MNVEQDKVQFEVRAMKRLLEKYPAEDKKKVASLGKMEVIACGYKPDSEHLQTIQNGFSNIRDKIGTAADSVFAGLKIYLVAEADGGGQALGRQNAVIIDGGKMGTTVGEMEAMLNGTGQYRKGDQSNLVGGQADASELGFVHELGHILEFRAHGDYDIGFKDLDKNSAPTEYGQKSAREDYAESWMYYIYGGPIDSKRQLVIESDLQELAKRQIL